MDARFFEIEHKYLVGDGFDLDGFRATVRGLGPVRTTALSVRDVYYLSESHPGLVFRHRYDAELQHLSVKSLESDPRVRLEVNLDLGQHRGDQQAAVEAFLAALGVVWRGVIDKDIEVFYFPDCEIVYYAASAGSTAVRCVEIEARRKTSIDAAVEILERYERRIGFDRRERTQKALVELLFPSFAERLRPAGEAMNDDSYTLSLAKQDFKFSCAHFLVLDGDRAELLHGHNYQVGVELRGRALDGEGLLLDLERVKSLIRAACARLDSRTLVPSRSRHVTVERRGGGVEVAFGDRRYRFPEADVEVLDEANTSMEVLARMLWRQLAAALDEPRVFELAVTVSQTNGQECRYRAPLDPARGRNPGLRSGPVKPPSV